MARIGGVRGILLLTALCAAALAAGCSTPGRHREVSAAPGGAIHETKAAPSGPSAKTKSAKAVGPGIEDLHRIPQEIGPLAAAAGAKLAIPDPCRKEMLRDFDRRFFAPWTDPFSDAQAAELINFMKKEGRTSWYGVNKRKVPPEEMRELVDNCALESFPARSDPAISVAPAHLRGLPTNLPFYEGADAQPFDMLSFPQVKLNEPLQVLHTSRDGVWLFVRTGYTSGWIERRNVALVNENFVETWTRLPRLVVVTDYAPVSDGTGVGVFRTKIGTILPLVSTEEQSWRVLIASAAAGEQARMEIVPLSRSAAELFPLGFDAQNLTRLGDQMLGQPYGWGEIYGLRDCSALLRDLFLPFGIWLPRTSVDQIAFVPRRIPLAGIPPADREETIRKNGIPFQTLVYKPGHIMLYVGVDDKGRVLVFHDAWSVEVAGKNGDGADAAASGVEDDKPRRADGAEGPEGREKCPGPTGAGTRVIGEVVITTLQPGKELGLVPGSSLLEKITEIGIVTGSCAK